MWAGVLTHIATRIDEVFGKWAVRIFRASHYKGLANLEPYLKEGGHTMGTNKRWKLLPRKTALIVVVALAVIGLAISFWFIFGVPSVPSIEETSSSDVVTIVFTSAVGLGALLKITDIFKVVS